MREPIDKILHDLLTDHAALGRLHVFHENAPKVSRALKRGEIDCVDGTAWSFPDSFFAFLIGISEFLPWAASSFPTPRKRHLVPVWIELCRAIHMALSEEPSFRGLEHLLKAGPILTRAKFNLGGCEGGFNYRNTYPRETALCPDTVRKYFRDTDPEALLRWYHGPVLAWFRRKRAFAKSRIFALDSTYVVVPDNERYEHTARLALDEHHQPIDTSRFSDEEKKRLRRAPCYKLTYLLHLGEEPSGLPAPPRQAGKPEPHPYFLIPAFRFGPGSDDSHEHGQVVVRERVTAFSEVRSWSQCPIPLYVALIHKECKTLKGNGRKIALAITSPEPFASGRALVEFYHRRSRIEEVNRALKQPRRLDRFTSPDYSLVVSHVAFTLLTYSLIEYYLKSRENWDMTRSFLRTLRREETLGKDAVVVHAQDSFGTFDHEDYTKILLELPRPARQRILKRIEVRRQERETWARQGEENPPAPDTPTGDLSPGPLALDRRWKGT